MISWCKLKGYIKKRSYQLLSRKCAIAYSKNCLTIVVVEADSCIAVKRRN